MTLTELAFVMFWLVVIVFGSVFFAEWAEKRTQSYAMESFAMESFAQFGMPALLWCGMLLLYAALQQKGLLR